MEVKSILEYQFINIGDFHMDLYNVITAVLIVLFARFSM